VIVRVGTSPTATRSKELSCGTRSMISIYKEGCFVATIRFTFDDRLDAMGALRDNIALDEKVVRCDGRLCGARPQIEDRSGRSLENTSEYIARFGSGPVPEHSHIVSSRKHPGARRYYTKVF
jgi:hypothetical protein